MALAILLLTSGAAPALGESLDAYGLRMCAESGIPPENCSFVSNPAVARQADFVREEELDRSSDKSATLLRHARRICEEKNVPLEDCTAMPSAYRGEEAKAATFLTVPESLPPVDPALVPAAPPPRETRVVRQAPPPAQPLVRPMVRPAPGPVRVEGPAFRQQPLPAPLPVERFERFDRFVEQPVIIDRVPAERFADRPVIIERVPAERFVREERVIIEERFVREGRPTGRCFRTVRYSAPPSYRFVDCF